MTSLHKVMLFNVEYF